MSTAGISQEEEKDEDDKEFEAEGGERARQASEKEAGQH